MRLYELKGNNPNSKTAVFTFGRFQPPTVGHERLILAVQETAQKLNADHFIFLSQTHNPPKDPLPWEDKVKIFKEIFPTANVWTDSAIRTAYEALEALGEDYDDVVMVVGGDRIDSFARMKDYTEEYGIEHFHIVSAGMRDPDLPGIEGMSASKAREFVAQGSFNQFVQALPTSVSDENKKKIYQLLRKHMQPS